MSKKPTFADVGSEAEKIPVRLSYGIVRLFSEGLYASPNKAIEELVANSFDAGARRVAVLLPSSFHDQGATIAVLDDGEGMDSNGLKQHWLIGKSDKRVLSKLPLDRQQIGKFGIGKLASYVLANRLTHISKKGSKYYSTSMNFKEVDSRGEEEVEPKTPIRISLRELTAREAREALKSWTDTQAFKKSGFKLFGLGANKSWTFGILSDLKDKVHEIRPGRLRWVLRTALPLRDDFAIYLDGTKLESSRSGKGRFKKWILGKDITSLPKPAADGVEAIEDKNQPTGSDTRFALVHEKLGKIRLSNRHHALLAQYVWDIGQAVAEVSRVLRGGGRAVYVVGDSTVRGTFIQNSSIVASVASEHGLTLQSRQSRELPANRRYLPPPGKDGLGARMDARMRREVVLAFSKAAT